MKKILEARIEQIIEFDSKSEYQEYIGELKKSNPVFEIIAHDEYKDGSVRVRIAKQYNKTRFLR